MPKNVEYPEHLPVLIVDDEKAIRDMIALGLSRSGYRCYTAESGVEALELLGEHPIDVVITDIRMPGMNGVDLLKKVKSKYMTDVMIMTGFTEDYNYESIITAGASDFIQKPISLRELMIRLKRVLRMRYLLIERDGINLALQDNIQKLETYSVELEDTHKELESSYLDTINRLVAAAEYKDEDTGDHIVRIAMYTEFMAKNFGLPEDTVKLLRYASPMHDIGKIGIPDKILMKPDRLTAEEFETIKTHTTIGASILSGSKADVLNLACEIALNHHERWNGSGYPNGLSKFDIPVSGRIVGLVDTFDALTSTRPYKKPYPVEVAVDFIRNERGTHFDPEIVDTFLSCLDGIKRIRQSIGSDPGLNPADMIWSKRDEDKGLDKRIKYRIGA